MSDVEQAMGVLSDSIMCECGNNSILNDFIEPNYIAWYKVVSSFYMDTQDQLIEDNQGSLSDDILWDTAKDGQWFCGKCGRKISVPKSMVRDNTYE